MIQRRRHTGIKDETSWLKMWPHRAEIVEMLFEIEIFNRFVKISTQSQINTPHQFAWYLTATSKSNSLKALNKEIKAYYEQPSTVCVDITAGLLKRSSKTKHKINVKKKKSLWEAAKESNSQGSGISESSSLSSWRSFLEKNRQTECFSTGKNMTRPVSMLWGERGVIGYRFSLSSLPESDQFGLSKGPVPSSTCKVSVNNVLVNCS